MVKRREYMSQFPIPCEECQSALRKEIESTKLPEITLRYCEVNRMLIILEGNNGQFVNWNIQGPMTAETALLTIDAAKQRIATAQGQQVVAH